MTRVADLGFADGRHTTTTKGLALLIIETSDACHSDRKELNQFGSIVIQAIVLTKATFSCSLVAVAMPRP
jgi:hypothetical protein